MAKTRSKPTNSKKTEAAGSAARDGAADIRMIPLDQLEPSPLNVRKVTASASDDAELLASIRETGIKQNLVVHALSETRFAVDAGGRRLKALKHLAEEGAIPADHPVPCLVEDERNAVLTSATENLQRAAMHPADQFEAFDKMIGEGRSEDEIALKFGVSVDLVRRRLKLARVAPEIIEQFRASVLTLECVMAFTLTDDHDRQLAVWNAVKGGYHIHPQSIKRQLTETAHSANSALGRFVGIGAYEAAGGVLLRDLFDDRASAHMENPELLERLAIDKLAGMRLKTGDLVYWDHLQAYRQGGMTAQDLRERSMTNAQAVINSPYRRRWIDHILNRLAYERDLLGAIERYEGELTPVILQAFAREHGAHKPAVETSETGFVLTSSAPLPLHLANGTSLDLATDDWRELMQSIGYVVPNKKPALPPILNFRAGEIAAVNRYNGHEPSLFRQVNMTKAAYAKIHSDARWVETSLCGSFRFKVAPDPEHKGPYHSCPRVAVFLTDSKEHPTPDSVTTAPKAA